jgi:hypothetical protein
MINLTAFITSLKSTWIRRAIHSEKIKYNIESKHVDLELLTAAGDKYIEISIENCKNEFWKDVLHACLKKKILYSSVYMGTQFLKHYLYRIFRSIFFKQEMNPWYFKKFVLILYFLSNSSNE